MSTYEQGADASADIFILPEYSGRLTADQQEVQTLYGELNAIVGAAKNILAVLPERIEKDAIEAQHAPDISDLYADDPLRLAEEKAARRREERHSFYASYGADDSALVGIDVPHTQAAGGELKAGMMLRFGGYIVSAADIVSYTKMVSVKRGESPDTLKTEQRITKWHSIVPKGDIIEQGPAAWEELEHVVETANPYLGRICVALDLAS